MTDRKLSDALKAAIASARTTAAADDMHAELRIDKAGLLLTVTAGNLGPAVESMAQSVIPWDLVDTTDALDLLVSGETLSLVEGIKYQAAVAHQN